MNDNTAKPDRLIRMPELSARTGLSRTTIYRRVKDGTLPRPLLIGSASIAWRESQIDDWIANLQEKPIEKAQAARPKDDEKP